MTAPSIGRTRDVDDAERRRIHWLALLLLLTLLVLTGWYFGLFMTGPVIVSMVG